MKPVIGIVVREGENESHKDVWYIYDHIAKALIDRGSILIGIIPPHREEFSKSEKEELLYMLEKCDGIIGQGGDFFYPYDLEIIKIAKEKNIPYLGICLSMQAMSTLEGGMIKDFEDEKHASSLSYVHDVYIDKNSKLYEIIGKEKISVNSRHHSYIARTNLDICAISDDQIIEAVEDKNLKFFMGIQWHPEDMISYDILANQLFDYFVNICRRN